MFTALLIANLRDPTDQTSPHFDERTYVERLHRVAGPGATVCGFTRVDVDATKAIACRDRALAARQPFIYALKQDGLRWWVGLVMDGAGDTWIVEFDHEFPDRGTIRAAPCHDPRMAGRWFRCAPHQ